MSRFAVPPLLINNSPASSDVIHLLDETPPSSQRKRLGIHSMRDTPIQTAPHGGAAAASFHDAHAKLHGRPTVYEDVLGMNLPFNIAPLKCDADEEEQSQEEILNELPFYLHPSFKVPASKCQSTPGSTVTSPHAAPASAPTTSAAAATFNHHLHNNNSLHHHQLTHSNNAPSTIASSAPIITYTSSTPPMHPISSSSSSSFSSSFDAAATSAALTPSSSPTLIMQGLYLGCVQDVLNKDHLKSLNIKIIINVAKEIKCFYKQTFTYYKYDFEDTEQQEILPHFDEINQIILHSLSSSSAVLLHCSAGISRSVACTVAFLMYHNGMQMHDALSFVKNKRTQAAPNMYFVKQLMKYDEILKQRRKQ